MLAEDGSDHMSDYERELSAPPTKETFKSDFLDNTDARKRPRLSPIEDDAFPIQLTSVPSRVKAKIRKSAINSSTLTGAVLAPTDSNITFESLSVKPWLVGSLNSMAIKRPTGIQKGCIPEILKGRDCIGGSRTGSGKTVAFAVPILQKWAEDPVGIFAIVLTPTRYASVM